MRERLEDEWPPRPQMDLKKEEDASEEGRRRVDKAREEEDGHYNEQKEDKALEEDRHDNELPAAKVLGEDRREPPLPALPEGNPQTFEEHLAMLADLTTYFHALNGTRPRVRPTGTPELGDLVEMAQGSDHLQGYAVVTEARAGSVSPGFAVDHIFRLSAQVHEAHLTVMVLYEDRRTVRAESWPYKSNVMLESVVGRLGKRVQVKPSCNAKWHSRTSAVRQIGVIGVWQPTDELTV